VNVHADILGAGHKGCSFLEGFEGQRSKPTPKGAPFYNV
jgi:hypothetical protein